MLGAAQRALGSLDGRRAKQLHLIQSSPKHAERLAASLQQKSDHAARMDAKAAEARERLDALRAEKAAALPQYRQAHAATLALRQRLADEISQRLDGRVVNIMGNFGE